MRSLEILSILKKALNDEKLNIKDIDNLSGGDLSYLEKVVEELPNNGGVSEWQYGMGNLFFEYHLHTNGLVPKLKELYHRGKRGGHPTLLAVYSKEELKEKILQNCSYCKI
ncbi:MAG: hypothetical protein PHE43_03150 [Candidatus Nanoarchaeia archaeon]|nr:hypothetical protein [Candidatus Nanoarchaeia archaeon]